MKRISIIIVLQCIIFVLFGQDMYPTGIIYGDNHAYCLTAPEGWVLDNKSGVDQGLYAVFYRQGESWENAETVMYTNTASLENLQHNSLKKLIKYDIKNFKKQYPGIKYTQAADVKIKEGVVATIKYISGKSYGNYEAIAYIDAGKTGVMIIMSSRTKNGFENSLAPFESLVKSYILIGDKVIIENEKQ